MVPGSVKPVKHIKVVALLFVMMAVLITALSPRPILAQEGKIGLNLSLVSGRYYNKVTAGKDNIFFLEIRNTGDKAITNIRLSSIKREGWVIDFKPSKIDYLGPGNFQTVDLNIRPPDRTAEGGYEVTLIAESNEIRKVLGIQTTVEAPKGYWLWIGGILLLVVVAGFIIVFLRFGRH